MTQLLSSKQLFDLRAQPDKQKYVLTCMYLYSNMRTYKCVVIVLY